MATRRGAASIQGGDGAALTPSPGASRFASLMNLLNNVVGAGLYSMPWVLMMASVLSGTAVTVLICLLNLASFLLLADACERTGTFSYLELGRNAFGATFGEVAQFVCVCYTAGSLVSYVVLAGDCLVGKDTGLLSLALGSKSFLGGGSLAARATVVYAVGAVAFVPLSMPRTIDALRYASYLAFVGTLYGFVVVVYTAVARPAAAYADDLGADDDGFPGAPVWAGFSLGVWQAVPIVNVAFTAHYNAPRYYFELRDRSVRRFGSVVATAMIGALAIYLGVAWAGYLAFRGATLGDVLEDFDATYAPAIAIRASLLVILFAGFPKIAHSNRDGVARLALGKGSDDLDARTYTALTLAVCVTVLTLGAVCTQVEVVLAYKGGVFGSIMVYIIPPLVNTAARLDKAENAYVRLEAAHRAAAPPPKTPAAVARAMFRERRFAGNALVFLWGTISGPLAVVITVLKQTKVLA